MKNKFWLKSMLAVLSAGTLLGLGYGGGCLHAVVQRVLVAVTFD